MHPFKVLYVEDDLTTQALLKSILKEFFKTVFICSNGIEALAIFEKEKIDLVITDINMPKMDGLKLSKIIKEKNQSLPILVVSAYNDYEMLKESINIGIDGYILKPVNMTQIVSEINKVVEKLELERKNKHNEKLLKEYKEAIDKSAIVSKADPKGIITYANDAFCQISGYTRDELLGKPHNIVRHPDMPSAIFKQMWETILSQNTWSGVVKNKKKNGEEYYVKSVIDPIVDEDGQIIEFIAIRDDITELEKYRQDLEGELKKATQEIIDTQKEVVFTMGAIGETRSKETGLHVKRVAEYSYILAKLSGLSDVEAELLKQASPMHDIGKVGIPDSVLNKPGKLTKFEWDIMQTHAQLGYEMLKHSQKDILKAAATVAYEHHEKWDGTGYPRGLSGEDIHIFGRITAIADVFDALGHDRCYKKAWKLEDILNLYKEQKGKQFDPKLIDLFFDNLDKFLDIQKILAD